MRRPSHKHAMRGQGWNLGVPSSRVRVPLPPPLLSQEGLSLDPPVEAIPCLALKMICSGPVPGCWVPFLVPPPGAETASIGTADAL